jgi:HD-GYP domain-containing protein (c-di-GMP phosphodiesterase class II)
MRIVPVNSVSSGIVLGQNIYSDNGDILLKKGVVLTDNLLTRILENNIFTIYINDGYTDQEIEDVIRPEVREKALKAIRNTFKHIADFSQQEPGEMRLDLKRQLQQKSMSKYMKRLQAICEYIVDDISQSQQLMINLVDIKNLNAHLYQHSLSVAILSVVIGIELKLDKHSLYNLFLGAVLHDIGKLFIPKDIVNPNIPLQPTQHNALVKHPMLGYEYLKENYHFEAPMRVIALQHHEHFDGSGYPRGTSHDNLHLFSRIVAVCNAYDNLVSDTLFSPAVSPHEAIEYLMGNAGSLFDFQVIDVFCHKVNPYPVGTIVMLSTMVYAVVIKCTPNYPLRPIVQLVDFTTKKLVGTPIDLMVIKDITIIDVYQGA